MIPILQIRELKLLTGWDLFEATALAFQILGPVGFGFKSLLHCLLAVWLWEVTVPPLASVFLLCKMGFPSLPHGTVVKSYMEVAPSWVDLAEGEMPVKDLICVQNYSCPLSLSLCSEKVFQMYRVHEWQRGVSGTRNGLKWTRSSIHKILIEHSFFARHRSKHWEYYISVNKTEGPAFVELLSSWRRQIVIK